MSVTAVALTWVIGGVLAAALLPRLRRRRLAALVPLAAAVAALLALGGGADLSALSAAGGLALGRAAGGVVLVSALAVTVCLLLAPPADPGEVAVIGACGSLSAVALATGSPLVFGVCLLGGMALMGIRLVAVAPARATLAGARAATLGAAALVGAAPFLPVDASSTPPRAHAAAGFLAGGIAAGFALLPFGGWVIGTARQVRGAALAPWALLLTPALLVGTQSLQEVLPPAARTTIGILLPVGALSLGWAALRSLGAADEERYPRVLLADLGLVAMGMATDQGGARLGSLLLMVTHLLVGPLLLQHPGGEAARPRRLAWLALSGVPPTPAFWGRFSVVAGLTAGLGGVPLLVTLPALGAVAVTAMRAMADAASAPGGAAGPAARAAAWLPPLAALAFGLVPTLTLHALLGVG